jgi:hypothetical protein
MANQDHPDFLRNSSTNSPEETWEALEFRFSELRDLVENARLENKDEAIGKRDNAGWRDTAPRWFDIETGISTRAWLLVPYVEGVDPAELQARVTWAKELIPPLEAQFARRILTPQFLRDWGNFCAATGAVELCYFSQTQAGRARSAQASGAAVSLDDHKRWFAHYFLRVFEGRGKRASAEAKVEALINAIIDGRIYVPDDWEVRWFERFLRLDIPPTDPEYAKLADAFRENKLSVRYMTDLVKTGQEGIPPLDLDFPTP